MGLVPLLAICIGQIYTWIGECGKGVENSAIVGHSQRAQSHLMGPPGPSTTITSLVLVNKEYWKTSGLTLRLCQTVQQNASSFQSEKYS
jgi:hypothetical protein